VITDGFVKILADKKTDLKSFRGNMDCAVFADLIS